MRIMVTGGAGFIGSYIVQECLEAGHAVAYRIEGALMWRVSKDIFSEIQVSYTHGSDEIEDRTINIGGFQVGVGLSFRL